MKMNGVNDFHERMKQAQGKKTVTPGDWDRNSQAKGGVNQHGGSKPFDKKPALGPAKVGTGKYHQHSK